MKAYEVKVTYDACGDEREINVTKYGVPTKEQVMGIVSLVPDHAEIANVDIDTWDPTEFPTR